MGPIGVTDVLEATKGAVAGPGQAAVEDAARGVRPGLAR